jgi:hypothetical protein
VAEVEFTAFATTSHPVTARLVVRRVRDRARTDELFPVWRYHPFFTDSAESTVDADITHRRHSIIETVFADLIDGPLAHMPLAAFSQQCVGDLRRDHAQLATRRRHPKAVSPRSAKPARSWTRLAAVQLAASTSAAASPLAAT